ncbi:MAG: cytosine permease [Firmicutes bacterium]|nr:cytosine permease [Bacillota bacterium]
MSDKGSDNPSRIETHGIDIIPETERQGHPRQLFWVWMAAQFTISGIIIGQLLLGLGLSLEDTIGVIIITSVSFVMVGLASLPGTATLTISRASFGVRGNGVPAFFSWLVLVGWESVAIVLTVNAWLLAAHLTKWPFQGTIPMLVALMFALVMTFSIPILGNGTVMKVQQILAYIMAFLVVLIFPLIGPKIDWNYAGANHLAAPQGTVATFILACSIGIMSTSLSWKNYGSDYTRYFARNTSRKSIVWYTTCGGGLAAFLFLLLEVLLGTFINPSVFQGNPMSGKVALLPNWYVFPFFFVVVLGKIANNYMNSYNSSRSFLAMGFKL